MIVIQENETLVLDIVNHPPQYAQSRHLFHHIKSKEESDDRILESYTIYILGGESLKYYLDCLAAIFLLLHIPKAFSRLHQD